LQFFFLQVKLILPIFHMWKVKIQGLTFLSPSETKTFHISYMESKKNQSKLR
jgi:hypothetical protein